MEEIYVVDGESYEDVEAQLTQAYDEMQQILQTQGNSAASEPSNIRMSSDTKPNATNANNQNNEPFGGFALVINGHSLVSRCREGANVKKKYHPSKIRR